MLDALEEIMRARLLVEEPDGRVAFAHDLVWETVGADVSAVRRAALQRRMAEALQDQPHPEQRAAELAWRFAEGDEPARALPYAFQAGRQCEQVHAHAEAEHHYRMALKLAQELGDTEHESLAEEGLGQALLHQARYGDARSVLEHAAAEAEHESDLARLVRLTVPLSRLDVEWGTVAEGVARVLRLIRTIEASGGASPDLVRLYLSLAHNYYASGQYAEELAAAEQALHVAQTFSDSGLEARARERRGAALSLLGRLHEADSELKAATQALDDLQDLVVLVLALSNRGTVLTRLGWVSEAQAHFERALAVAEQMGSPDWVAWQSANCGLASFVRGNWLLTHRYLEQAVALRLRFEPAYWTSAYLYEIEGQMQLAEGQLKRPHGAPRRGWKRLSVAEISSVFVVRSAHSPSLISTLAMRTRYVSGWFHL